MQILQQHKDIVLSFNIQAAQSHTNPIDMSKLTTGDFVALQRKEIWLHPTEHRTQAPKPGLLDRPLVQLRLQRADSMIKRNHELPTYRKGIPNTAI